MLTGRALKRHRPSSRHYGRTALPRRHIPLTPALPQVAAPLSHQQCAWHLEMHFSAERCVFGVNPVCSRGLCRARDLAGSAISDVNPDGYDRPPAR
jgi:hypothetical protein